MVDGFFKKFTDAITGNEEQSEQDGDSYEQVSPSSADPYSDPADYGSNSGQFGDVRPASEDPYGDPADYGSNVGQFGDVRPASEDPYGDPADQENY